MVNLLFPALVFAIIVQVRPGEIHQRFLPKSDVSVDFNTSIICNFASGWVEVEHDVYIPFDLETTPLQFKTFSEVGQGEASYIGLYTADKEYAAGLHIFYIFLLRKVIISHYG